MKLIDILRSRRYAITFIIFIILCLILSTVIPQRSRVSDAEWLRFRSNYPEFSEIISLTGLDHLYTSWWFLAIIVLFSINIALNLVDRIRSSWKQYHDLKPLSPLQIKVMSLKVIIHFSNDKELFLATVENILRRFRYNITKYSQGLIAHKARIGYFWIPIFHGSILIVLFGILISGLFRFSSTVELSEGQSFHGREDEFINRWYGLLKYRPEMNFTVRLNKYNIEYWNEKGHPKLYQSLIDVNDRKRKAFTIAVEMNKPLRYRGYSFYQTKYWGYSPLLGLSKNGSQESTGYVNLPYKEKYDNIILKQFFLIPETGLRAFLEYDTSNNILKMEIKDGLKVVFDGILKEGDSVKLNDNILRFHRTVKWTGLYISYDPGVPVVYFGFALLVLSSIGMVFFYPKKIWLCLENNSLLIGVDAGRRKDEFRDEFENIVMSLKEVIS